MLSLPRLSISPVSSSLLFFSVFLASCGGGGGGSGGVAPTVTPPAVVDDPVVAGALTPRTRYGLNNQCFAIQALANDNYLAPAGNSYSASAAELDGAEAFFFKPTALGSYLLYNRNRQILIESGNQLQGSSLGLAALSAATDSAVFTLFVKDDATTYPVAPQYDIEPTPALVDAYRAFSDPNIKSTDFRIIADSGNAISSDSNGALTLAAANGSPNQSFRMHPLSDGCADFPEAQSNVQPQTQTFKGTTTDGRVLGMADAHVHISATTFLGRSEWGSPFHKFGVTHALDDCDEYHGPNGDQDEVSAFFGADTNDPTNNGAAHPIDGWPTFTFWPSRSSLTHEAIYWRWLERSWQAGLRIAVNESVDNQTLCELQRQASGDQTIDCNPMNNAVNQVGSMFAMQDYIDAQFGGRGEGFFQIVYDSAEARSVIEAGKLAIVLGIEISNLFNCQVTFDGAIRSDDVDVETADSVGVGYGCTMAEDGSSNSIEFQMERIRAIGIRKIISIHEFDNAFGGNGIFLSTLNAGTFENSQGEAQSVAGSRGNQGKGSGEFWTTYNCPKEGETFDGKTFTGYLWSGPGESFGSTSPPGCAYLGLGGRPGGNTMCYPDEKQCNARWMTKIGLYMYAMMMEKGFIFDIDHLELQMKTQALELAEAQNPVYPFVSTHGTFGGTSVDQAQRILRNGGFLYPSNGSTSGFLKDMKETKEDIYDAAMSTVPIANRPIFGFGFGTDTNGLSTQTSPRGGDAVSARPLTYPFILFSGAKFSDLTDFSPLAGVVFDQPGITPEGADTQSRTWHQDEDGNAHHGMLADWVKEIQLEGDAENIEHLYNSAEAFLQTWERTELAAQGIASGTGKAVIPAGILRIAPKPSSNRRPFPGE